MENCKARHQRIVADFAPVPKRNAFSDWKKDLERPQTRGCWVCLQAALALNLLDEVANDDERTDFCEAAKTVVPICQKDYVNGFNALSEVDNTLRGRCALPARVPSPRSAPRSSSKRAVLLGTGIGTAVVGGAFVLAAIFTGTTVAPQINKMSGCVYQGFDVPCYDLRYPTGFGVAGGVLTLTGLRLIVGGYVGAPAAPRPEVGATP